MVWLVMTEVNAKEHEAVPPVSDEEHMTLPPLRTVTLPVAAEGVTSDENVTS